MAESTHEQISAAIKARLETITTGPPRVIRCRYWPNNIDVSRDLTLYLKAEPYTCGEGATGDANGGFANESAPFSILIVKKYERASTHPDDEDKSSDDIGPTVLSRVIRDVVKALLREVTLGGLAWNIADGLIDIDPTYPAPGAFLAAELKFSTKYSYKVSAA